MEKIILKKLIKKDLEAFNKRKEDPITYEITEKSPSTIY